MLFLHNQILFLVVFEAKRVILEIVKGTYKLHKYIIIDRDLKASNTLIDKELQGFIVNIGP